MFLTNTIWTKIWSKTHKKLLASCNKLSKENGLPQDKIKYLIFLIYIYIIYIYYINIYYIHELYILYIHHIHTLTNKAFSLFHIYIYIYIYISVSNMSYIESAQWLNTAIFIHE